MHPSNIVRSPFQLRPVKKQTVEYLQLRASIKQLGILQPVLVRERNGKHEIIDGAHRHECALDLNIDVPIHKVHMTDEEVLRAQVVTNEQRIKTLDADLVRRLWKIARDTDHRVVAASLGKSLAWLKMVCQLERLSPASLALFDRGKLSFRQAVLLARVPRHYQEQCWALSVGELQQVVRTLKAEGRCYISSGVTPMYRPIVTVIDEYERPTEAGRVIMNETDGSPVAVWKAALRWATQMDAATFRRRQRKFDKMDDNRELPDDNVPAHEKEVDKTRPNQEKIDDHSLE